MSKVLGKYIISAVLPFGEGGDSPAYEFDGETRDAQFFASSPNKILNTICLSEYLGGGSAAFCANTNITIVRARLNPDGAAELQNAPGEFAGRVFFSIRQGVNGTGPELDTFTLTFKHWGEWTEFNKVLRPYKKNAEPWSDYAYPERKPCRMSFDYQNTVFTCDDYNIQDAYVGQALVPTIDFEIKTAGIVSSVTGAIF